MPRLFGKGSSSKEKSSGMGFLNPNKQNSLFKRKSQNSPVNPHNWGLQYFSYDQNLHSHEFPGPQINEACNMQSPPPYSAMPLQNATAISSNQPCSSDSPYDFLREFDTIFVVDDSSSMCGPRWKEAKEAIAAIAPICTQYDSDGIDLYFLNHRNPNGSAHLGAYTNITTASDVQRIFSNVYPCGGTPFGRRLHQVLNPYMNRLEAMTAALDQDGEPSDRSLAVRPLNIIAITDGVFTDDAESVIVKVARELDSERCKAVPWQIGIQFFQVGDDQEARRYLEELDDGLETKVQNEHIRDIVDTVPWKGEHGQKLNGDGILKVVLGAVHKKYDNRCAFA